MLFGKSFCGKTSIIESMINKNKLTGSFTSYNSNLNNKNYCETPGFQQMFIFIKINSNVNIHKYIGISVSRFYWPVKLANSEKFLMFNLAMWDAGKVSLTKYDYIEPVS